MKLFRIIQKNFRILFRSKGSAFIVLFGPLLLVALVGFALYKPTTFDFSIGYYTPTLNNLTKSFLSELEETNYNLERLDAVDICIQNVKYGVQHTCIVFPGNFSLDSNSTSEIKFYVDNSRLNIVYLIIGSVSSKLNMQEEQLSVGLTNQILNVLTNTEEIAEKQILESIKMKDHTDTSSSDVDSIKSSLDKIDLQMVDVDLTGIDSRYVELKNYAEKIESRGASIVTDWEDLYGYLDQNDSKVDAVNDSVGDLERGLDDLNTTYHYISLTAVIDKVSENVDKLDTKLKSAKISNENIKNKIDSITTNLKSLKTEIDAVKASFESIKQDIDGIEIKSAEKIINPVTTKIEPVLAEYNQFRFTFPSLLVLVIMFIGLMLSSTLIVLEKKSTAFFRNFTTATRDEFFIAGNFITSFIMILVQVVIIVLIAFYFLKEPVFGNILVSAVALFLLITLFTLIGMIIGYLSPTQEAVTIAGISVGTIFLFLSNLVLPIESMDPLMKRIAHYNPFVSGSDLLRKAFLFDFGFNELKVSILIVLGVSVLMIILIIFTHRLSKLKYFQKIPHIRRKMVFSPEDSILIMGHHKVKNEESLLKTLKMISDKEFYEHVNKDQNEISQWVKEVLGKKFLALRLKKVDRSAMITILEKHLSRPRIRINIKKPKLNFKRKKKPKN